MKDKLIALLGADPGATEEQLLSAVGVLKVKSDATISHAKRQALISDIVSKTNMPYEAACQLLDEREAADQKLAAAKAKAAKPQAPTPAAPTKPPQAPQPPQAPAEAPKPAEQPKQKNNLQSR